MCVPPKVPLPLGRHLPSKAASGEIKGSLRDGRNQVEETQPTQKGQGLPGEATLGAGALVFNYNSKDPKGIRLVGSSLPPTPRPRDITAVSVLVFLSHLFTELSFGERVIRGSQV